MDRDTAPSRHRYNVDKLSCVMSNSHQRDSRKLSSSVRLCERIQPSMWLHLCPHLRASTPTHKQGYARQSPSLLLLSFWSHSFSCCVHLPESPTKPRCSASSRPTWEASSLAPWSTRSSRPACPSSTATWPRLSNLSRTFDTYRPVRPDVHCLRHIWSTSFDLIFLRRCRRSPVNLQSPLWKVPQ